MVRNAWRSASPTRIEPESDLYSCAHLTRNLTQTGVLTDRPCLLPLPLLKDVLQGSLGPATYNHISSKNCLAWLVSCLPGPHSLEGPYEQSWMASTPRPDWHKIHSLCSHYMSMPNLMLIFSFPTHYVYRWQQESILLGCVPPACQPYVLWWSPDVRTGGGVLNWISLNRSLVITTRCY